MTYYSQKDPRWANIEYAPNCTYAKYGCFVTSLAMMCDRTPLEVGTLLRANGCISDSGILKYPNKVASLLGLEYLGESEIKPNFDCIADTYYYDKPTTSYTEQHFFVIKVDGSILDPLGLRTSYPIATYRLFRRSNMGRVVWNSDVEVIFNQGQVNEMAGAFGLNHSYSGNESWGFVQECEGAVSRKVAELNDEINRFKNLPPRIEIKEVIKEVPVEAVVEKPVIIEKEVQIKPTWSIIWKLILEKLTKE